jgi:hypothetical protein
LAQGPSQLGKLGHRQAIATAVAADEQAEAASGRFAQQGKGVGIARSRMHGQMRLKRTLSLQNRPTTAGRLTGNSHQTPRQPSQAPQHPSKTTATEHRTPPPAAATSRLHRQKTPTDASCANNWMLKSAPTAAPRSSL